MQNGDRPPLTPRNERKIIFLIGALAAVHVFIFSAAFPFFNNVDEPIHFDLVLRYSAGAVPHGPDRLLRDTVEYIAFYNSWSYNGTLAPSSNGLYPPPLWTEPPKKKRQDFDAACAQLQLLENYEISQPPLYYSVAGLWWDAGKLLGFHGGGRLYWLRCFNVLEMFGLVWLAYVAARLVFPDNLFIRVAVPLILALIPQTAFYSISNDPLSALCFGVLFLCLLKWLREPRPSACLGAVTGLAFAATYLAKVTNFPLLIVVAVAFGYGAIKFLRHGQKICPAALAFLSCAIPPVVGWMLWCQRHFGDLTGSKLACNYFGLTIKPFAEWLHHPIFSPLGVWTYLSGQLSTFCQGEFNWHNQPLILPGSMVVYTLLSLGLLACALPGLFPRINPDSSQRRALGLGLVCFTIMLGFFAFVSIIYNFDQCPNPSREHPYIREGRLMLGALLPFLLLVIYGLDRLLARFGNRAKFTVLGIMVLVMLASEIATDWPVFSSPFNWFHLP